MGTHKLQLVMATTVTLHTRLMPRRTEWYIAIEERGLTRTARIARTPETCEREHYATYNTKDVKDAERVIIAIQGYWKELKDYRLGKAGRMSLKI